MAAIRALNFKICSFVLSCDVCQGQWRNQEFCSGGGFNKFSWGQRTERTGIWGR